MDNGLTHSYELLQKSNKSVIYFDFLCQKDKCDIKIPARGINCNYEECYDKGCMEANLKK